MAASGLLSNVKIRTKIIVSFCGLVVCISGILAIWDYWNLNKAINKEFTTRVGNDTQSFTTLSNDSLLLGDVDTVITNMESRLNGSDLVAILVYDVSDNETPHFRSSESKLSQEMLQNTLKKNKVGYALQGEDSTVPDKDLDAFSRGLKRNGDYGFARNVELNGKDYLIYTTSGILVQESSGTDAAAESDAGGGLDDLLGDLGTETAEADPAVEGQDPATADDPLDALGLGEPAADPAPKATASSGSEVLSRVFFVYSQERIEGITSNALNWALILIALAGVISLALGFFLANHLIKPIDDVVTVLKDMAEGEGDLSVRLTARHNDEMGDLCKWFNTFVGKLNDLITRMDKTSHLLGNQLNILTENIDLLQHNVNSTDKAFRQVADVGESLQTGIGSISSGTETSHAEMEKVSDGATEMSNNISDVSKSVQLSVENLSEVASAVEELSATFQEIARNMDHNRVTTNKAADLSGSASDNVKVLDEHARNIGDFVQIIDAISKQTNLLALNATIEAASAGEAGKGFAVVANEVKDLAKQTAQAVQQIGHRVHEIQESTNSTISAIEEIKRVMSEVSSVNSTVVASIEEQASTVQEIHRNLDNTSHESAAISQAVQASLEISIEVSDSCQSAFKNTSSVLKVSRDILQHSRMLAEKSEEAQGSSAEMVAALGSSYTSVKDLSRAAQSMLAITGKFKYIDESGQNKEGSGA